MNKAMQLKARIKKLALKNHIPAQAVLQNFMLERLLQRISLSPYKNRIILKGGMLIASLVGISSRTTMDMDTTLKGYPLTEETIRAAFCEICAMPLDDEIVLTFEHVGPIREDDEYGGFRVAILARYDSIQIPLKIDVTTGDRMTPEAVHYAFPSSFENEKFEVCAYNIETILAEKVETILRRSVLNTRIRDFYDVYILMRTRCETINKDIFRAALHNTAEKRGSLAILQNHPTVIGSVQADATMRQRWERYAKEYSYASGIPFEAVIAALTYILAAEHYSTLTIDPPTA